mgnify:CR=1 FL=1
MPFELPYPLQFHGIISTIGPMDILDIFIVAVILYKSTSCCRTRAQSRSSREFSFS